MDAATRDDLLSSVFVIGLIKREGPASDGVDIALPTCFLLLKNGNGASEKLILEGKTFSSNVKSD